MSPRRLPAIAAFLFAFIAPLQVQALELEAGPYVQDVTANGARLLWESDQPLAVAWGSDTSMATLDLPVSHRGGVQQVYLSGLEPDTTYLYALEGGDDRSATHAFHTARAHQAATRFLVISDSQEDRARPDLFDDLIQRVTHRLWADAPGELAEYLDFVLHTGDVVDDGAQRHEWTEDFLAPAQELLAAVPLYAVLGNHEADARHYFDYLQLPSRRSEGEDNPERWYRVDRGNLCVIALDSNLPHADEPQLAWL